MNQLPTPADETDDHKPMSSNGSEPKKKNGYNWFAAIWPVAIIALCGELGIAVLNNSTLPVYFTKGLKISTSVMTWLMIPFFVSELLKSPLGVLGDKYGRKPLMLLGTTITIFTPLILMTIHYPPSNGAFAGLALIAFGLLRLLDGLGGAALWPSLYAYVGDEVREDKRGAAMGVLNVVYMIAMALSFWVAGKLDDNFDPRLTGEHSLRGQLHLIGSNMHNAVQQLSDRVHHTQTAAASHVARPDLLAQAMADPHHYHPSFYLVTALFCLATLACVFGLRSRRPGAHPDHPHQDESPITLAGFVATMKRVPEFLGLAFVTFFGIGCIAPIPKLFVIDEFHLTEEGMGLLMAQAAAVLAILAYPLGHLSDRIGKALAVRIGFIFSAAGLWGIPILHGMHDIKMSAFVVSAVVLGIGSAITFPAWNALLTMLADERRRATVFGAVSTAQAIGVLMGFLTGGALYDHSHIAPFVVAAVFVTLSAVLALIFVRERRLKGRF